MQTIDFKIFQLRHGDRVLDLGCGEGRHAIHAYLEGNVSSFAIDLNFHSLSIAKKKARDFIDKSNDQKGLSFLQCNGCFLPFANDSFDKIICSEVLEHIDNYQAILAEITRVLKPSGFIAVSVPRYWPEKICWLLNDDYHQVEGGHVRIFNTNELRKTIESFGFSYQFKHWAHALHSPFWWLKCIFWKTKDRNYLIEQYHRLLVWDLMEQPKITRLLEKILNPIMGKSVVLYFNKAGFRSYDGKAS